MCWAGNACEREMKPSAGVDATRRIGKSAAEALTVTVSASAIAINKFFMVSPG
jgi:hypothetical protein